VRNGQFCAQLKFENLITGLKKRGGRPQCPWLRSRCVSSTVAFFLITSTNRLYFFRKLSFAYRLVVATCNFTTPAVLFSWRLVLASPAPAQYFHKPNLARTGKTA
jgi:hypothetical protein